jgi:hypothetical protein
MFHGNWENWHAYLDVDINQEESNEILSVSTKTYNIYYNSNYREFLLPYDPKKSPNIMF